jgi:hypothetical protein
VQWTGTGSGWGLDLLPHSGQTSWTGSWLTGCLLSDR